MNPISLCIITKNDPAILNCIKSIRPYVKEIVVVDGGSTYENQKLVQEQVDIFEVYTKGNNKDGLIEDFSKQRNRSFELATQPWILWADSDDIIEGGEHLKDIISQYNSPISIMFPYEYAYDGNAKPILTQYRERLFYQKENFEWRAPVHEVCCSKTTLPQIQCNQVVWKHQRQYSSKKQESGRNLRIMKKYVEKIGESDPRQIFYLAQEHRDNGNLISAIKYYSRYVEISKWPDEQVMACLTLSELTKELKWAFKAIEIKPDWAEGYLAAGKIFYGKNNWQSCVDFIKLGLSKPPTKTTLFINPAERNFDIHLFYNFALNSIGKVDEALESCKLGLSYRNSDVLQSNKIVYQRHLNPSKKLTDSLDIVFALGDGLQTWNSQTVKETGIGGSELMAIHMSEGLAQLGHHVTIYNSCGHKAVINGVVYQPTANLSQHQGCDVLIVSRYAYFLDSIPAQKKFLWIHDVVAQYATPELIKLADKVLVLSEWHKQNVMKVNQVPEDKIIITRNGIDLNRFQPTKKEQFRCINSSSPERSWRTLLDCWPEIKRRVPGASLHLFYGFEDLLKSKDNIPLVEGLKKKIEELASSDVYYHGRVNQEELAKEFMKSEVWLYPTLFLETYCIGAAEAQAAGCRMVTSNLAALNETVGKKGTLIQFGHPQYNEMFIEASVNALLQTTTPQYDVKDFDLPTLINDWNKIIHE
jgi:glycosyltransferase involved in cell wall biosynthesis